MLIFSGSLPCYLILIAQYLIVYAPIQVFFFFLGERGEMVTTDYSHVGVPAVLSPHERENAAHFIVLPSIKHEPSSPFSLPVCELFGSPAGRGRVARALDCDQHF